MTEAEFLASTDPSRMLEWLTAERVRPDGTAAGMRPIHGSDFQISDRRLRLFACACARQVWDILTERSRDAVDVAERYADGLVTLQELMTAHDRASKPALDGSFEAELAWRVSQQHARALSANNALPRWFSVSTKLDSQQAVLLRTIVGNPFRPATICGNRDHGSVVVRPYCPACRRILDHANGTVPKLAQVIYDERRWDSMPMLADALEESGCRDEVILRWCRGEERCYRGHWPARPKNMTEAYTQVDPTKVQTACVTCKGTGWIPRRGPSVRGDWCIDLLLGKK
jgi:hypothetical protein